MNLWRDFVAWFNNFQIPQAEVPMERPPVPTPGPDVLLCPSPLSSDDGTMADCKTKRHCGCEDAL